VLSSILPPIPVKADVRIAQIKTASDPEKMLRIAKALSQSQDYQRPPNPRLAGRGMRAP